MSEKKTSLIDRIMESFKEMGHKKIVQRVIKKSERILGETIYNAEKKIERLKEKIVDKKEDIDSARIAIDPEIAKGQEEHYAKQYLDGIKKLKSELSDFEDQMEVQEEILALAKEELTEIK